MAYLVITAVLPSTVDRWLGGVHWLDLRHLGLLPATAIALFVLEVATYWWHRSLHASRVPWRWCHQMHHSAERLDVFGAFVFHPFDLVGFILMAGVLPVWVIGLDPVAVGLANVIIFAAVVLGHANIRLHAGSATSCSAPRITRFIISAGCTLSTTRTSR